MPTTAITLRLTNGTTTADFSTASAAFSLRAPGWEPMAAQLRDNDLGGQSDYADATEVIPLYVLGSTAAIAQANLTALQGLLDQARRFDRGELETAVRIEAQVQGSDLAAPLQARVIRGQIERVGVEYIEGTLYASAGIPIDLVVTHTMPWLASTEEASTQDTSFTSTDTATLTFATNLSGDIHPTRIEITQLTATSVPWNPGYLVMAPSANQLQLVEAESAGYTNDTPSTDAPRMARGGSYALFSATSAGGSVTPNAALLTSRVLHTFASVSMGVGTWQTWRRLWYGGAYVDPPPMTITLDPAALVAGDPMIITYPPIAPTSDITGIELVFLRTSGTAGAFGIDWLLHAGDAQVIRINRTAGYPTSTPLAFHVSPNPLTGRRPQVAITSNGGAITTAVGYEGDAYLTSTGTTIAVAWMQLERNASAAQGFWTISSSGISSSAKTHTIQAYRRTAYTVPV